MKIKAVVLGVACITVVAGAAEATWLSGGFRTMRNLNRFGDYPVEKNGLSCRQSNTFFYCPFVSDSTTLFGGDSTAAYVDYYQSHPTGSTGSITSSACRQSWTGSAIVCAPGTATFTGGMHDVSIAGWAYAGTASVYDYFSVVITRSLDGLTEVLGFSPY